MHTIDGEPAERAWANVNPLSHLTREMGLGQRRDTLDDYLEGWQAPYAKVNGPCRRRNVRDAKGKKHQKRRV